MLCALTQPQWRDCPCASKAGRPVRSGLTVWQERLPVPHHTFILFTGNFYSVFSHGSIFYNFIVWPPLGLTTQKILVPPLVEPQTKPLIKTPTRTPHLHVHFSNLLINVEVRMPLVLSYFMLV